MTPPQHFVTDSPISLTAALLHQHPDRHNPPQSALISQRSLQHMNVSARHLLASYWEFTPDRHGRLCTLRCSDRRRRGFWPVSFSSSRSMASQEMLSKKSSPAPSEAAATTAAAGFFGLSWPASCTHETCVEILPKYHQSMP